MQALPDHCPVPVAAPLGVLLAAQVGLAAPAVVPQVSMLVEPDEQVRQSHLVLYLDG